MHGHQDHDTDRWHDDGGALHPTEQDCGHVALGHAPAAGDFVEFDVRPGEAKYGERIPFPDCIDVRIRFGDGREYLAKLPARRLR